MKSNAKLVLIAAMLSMFFASCSTFNPAAVGTDALVTMTGSSDAKTSDAKKAALHLSDRKLSEADGRKIMTSLQSQNDADVCVALLKTINVKKMTYLREDLENYLLKSHPAKVTAEAANTILSMITEPNEALALGVKLIPNEHAEVRARAAQLLVKFPVETVEPLFIKALETESSATVATYMCEFLAQKGTEASLPILNKIANDTNRKFTSDKYLNISAQADSVRAAAVRGAERLK